MDLQPWNTELTVEPHTCEFCSQVVIDPSTAQTEEIGLKTQLYKICNFVDELQSHQNSPHTCGLIRHHIEHRGPAFVDAVNRGVEPNNQDLILEVHSYDGEGYQIRTAYTKFRGSRIAEFDIYSYPDDPAASYVARRPVNRRFNSEQSFTLAKNWLINCSGGHENCPKYDVSELPTRVLDVSSEPIKLSIPSEEIKGSYAALSYCWGGPQPMKTTISNVERYTIEIDENKLPKTIRDAIEVTRNLNLQFLWVDSLCIIQDDVRDVARELNKMPQIYAQALVTISATSAQTCNDGFLQEREPPMSAYWAFKVGFRCPDGQLGSVIMENHQPLNESDEPIHSRGWTLQETLLSPRFLSYGTRQIRWRCPSYHLTEGGRWDEGTYDANQFLHGKATIPEKEHYLWGKEEFDKDEEDKFDVIDRWNSIVTAFSARNLSVPSDKLPAISAIAQELSTKIGGDYLAGLWSPSLLLQLLWNVEAGEQRPRPASYRAPSWSWASVDGVISPGGCHPYEDPECVEILSCVVKPLAPEAPFGEIKSGILKIGGRLKTAKWDETREFLKDPSFIAYEDKLPMELTMDCCEELPEEIWCLELQAADEGFRPDIEGILLLPCPEEDVFRRLGRFSLSTYRPQTLSDGHRQEHGLLCRLTNTLAPGHPERLPDWFVGCEKKEIVLI